MNGNYFPLPPPPSYEMSVRSTNVSATAPTVQVPIGPIGPPTSNDSSPYPNSSGTMTRVPASTMVYIGHREPPPAYNPGSVIPTAGEGNNTISQPNNSGQSPCKNKCMITLCAYSIGFVVLLFLTIYLPENVF